MKQSEKLDLILRGLYQKNKIEHTSSLEEILQEINLVVEYRELMMLAHRLRDDNFIESLGYGGEDIICSITTYGIDYCEGDSYTHRGHSLITNNYSISVNDSSNTSIVQNSQNVAITNNADVKGIISELRCALETAQQIEPTKKQEMIDCLDEVETVVNAGKTPKASVTYLLSIASDIATVSPVVYVLVKSLVQSIGITLP